MKKQLGYSVSNFIKLLETLILNIGLARVILDISDFGKLQQFFVIATFFVTIASAFPTSLNFFLSKNPSRVLKNALFMRFFYSMSILAVIACFLFFILDDSFQNWFLNDFFTKYIYYFIPILFFKIINSFFSNYYLFTNKLKYLNIISFLFLVLYFTVFVYFKLKSPSIEVLLFLFSAYEILKFLALFLPFMREVKGETSAKIALINKEEFNFVVPTVFLVIAGILNMQIDKYMISAMLTPEIFAKYQVGAFNIPFISVITISFFTIITPKITGFLEKNNISETLKLTRLTVKQTSVLLLPIFVFCFFFSSQIIILLFGERFESSGEIFKIYTLRFLISVFPFSIYMGIIGLKNFAAIHVVVSAIVNILCNFILIPKFGDMGAVIATIIASYSTVVIPIYFINKRLKTNLQSYFPILSFVKILSISVIIVFPLYFLFNDLLKDHLLLYIIPIAIMYYLITVFIIERKIVISLIKRFT